MLVAIDFNCVYTSSRDVYSSNPHPPNGPNLFIIPKAIFFVGFFFFATCNLVKFGEGFSKRGDFFKLLEEYTSLVFTQYLFLTYAERQSIASGMIPKT